ncbi:hypothetical protein E1176_03195 [Fulvivirga sp. RKSG066]|uniref:hypothetical protein n=1 Tax=Fulvivirga aurantia TaxID=2529383 RepID=UPI0012BB8772|nr:hypothetical protein [Fulvivirga aurantia]MTI20019.1 hypothetical protein [Fulvivirga aurantia]
MSQHNLKTLVEVLNDLKEQGYTADFDYREGKLVTLGNTDSSFDPDGVTIKEEFRFEGETNPADSSILYAIETADHTKGTLVDSYGADTHTDLEDFLKKANDQTNQ